jgi:hypothetical protein
VLGAAALRTAAGAVVQGLAAGIDPAARLAACWAFANFKVFGIVQWLCRSSSYRLDAEIALEIVTQTLAEPSKCQ